MIKIPFEGTITLDDIKKFNAAYRGQEIIITIKNTKEQSPELIEQIGNTYPNIKFSVLGGLDPKKKKFDDEHYQRRTYFSGVELSKIIRIYQSIERKIDLNWTETQKAMFIYKELCNYMQYSECQVNGRDYSRGIGGLLYKKAVCSGFAMIFKEAMDRMGIECHYQNIEGHHSWNIAKLDGKYRALELTWDTSHKKGKGCQFYYFNRDNSDFYSNKHHDLSTEPEECKFPITPYTTEELRKAHGIISKPRILTIPLTEDSKGYKTTAPVKINHSECEFFLKDGVLYTHTLGNQPLTFKTFTRDDDSSFMILPSALPSNIKGMNRYLVLEPQEDCIKVGRIYSESSLENIPKKYESTVANGLLSKERLARKINSFNGYVGYVGKNHGIYYSSEFEKKELNIIR